MVFGIVGIECEFGKNSFWLLLFLKWSFLPLATVIIGDSIHIFSDTNMKTIPASSAVVSLGKGESVELKHPFAALQRPPLPTIPFQFKLFKLRCISV